jgi:hypothetical protein
MYEEFVIVWWMAVGRRGDVPEGSDGMMVDGGMLGSWISSHCGVIPSMTL